MPLVLLPQPFVLGQEPGGFASATSPPTPNAYVAAPTPGPYIMPFAMGIGPLDLPWVAGPMEWRPDTSRPNPNAYVAPATPPPYVMPFPMGRGPADVPWAAGPMEWHPANYAGVPKAIVAKSDGIRYVQPVPMRPGPGGFQSEGGRLHFGDTTLPAHRALNTKKTGLVGLMAFGRQSSSG